MIALALIAGPAALVLLSVYRPHVGAAVYIAAVALLCLLFGLDFLAAMIPLFVFWGPARRAWAISDECEREHP